MTTLKAIGTKYPLRRSQLDEIQRNGFIELLIFHPVKNFNRTLLTHQEGNFYAMYEVIIATTNPKEVEDAIVEYMNGHGVMSTDYLITLSTSRFQDSELRSKYPSSVRIALAIGVPFNYSEIVQIADSKSKGSHYLATPYNNGLCPTSNVWFEIPEDCKAARMIKVGSVMSSPQTKYGEDRIEKLRRYDTELLHTLLDEGRDLKTHIGYNAFNGSVHSGDTVDSRFSICVRANDSLNRNKPIIPLMSVTGVECMSLRDSVKHAKLVGMEEYIDGGTNPPMLRGLSPTSMNGSRPKTYLDSPEYIFARRVAKYSGRFSYYKTCLSDFLISLQRNEPPPYRTNEVRFLCNKLLVLKIRIAVNKTQEIIGD